MIVSDKNKLNRLVDLETPKYIWDLEVFEQRVRKVQQAFSAIPNFRLLYSMKSNPSKHFVRKANELGIGIDVCSIGEVDITSECGLKSGNIYPCLFAPGEEDLVRLANEECSVDLDSVDDIDLWRKITAGKKEFGVRVNPDVKAGFHEHCESGVWDSKYGVSFPELNELFTSDNYYKENIAGIHLHIGSSSYDPSAYLEAIAKTVTFIQEADLSIQYLNIGGGWGVPFDCQDEQFADEFFNLDAYVSGVVEILRNADLLGEIEVRAEPGEYLSGPSGFILSKVLRVITRRKGTEERNIVVLDASSNMYPGPSLYGAENYVYLVNRDAQERKQQVLAGRTMLSGDLFGPERYLPVLRTGDKILIGVAGAYSFAKANRFNSLEVAEEFLL